jgi:hypothetical protein
MCFSITSTNANEVDNLLGKKYISICEQNDPIVSRLVRYLRYAMQKQRENRQKAILATAAYHNRDLGAPPSDTMPRNLRYFPHDCETESGLIFPVASGTERSFKWQVFSGFLATLNDAGFPRTALYELLRKTAEDHDFNRILTADDKSSFAALANRRSDDAVRRIEVIWGRGKRRKQFDVWQLAHQHGSHVTVNRVYYPLRYIDCTEVDWWKEREKIIVPKDYEIAMNLLHLKKLGIWNFAHNLDEIIPLDQCWQNILIFKI